MIVPSTFIVASLICGVSATNLQIKPDASVPNILEDASEVPGDGTDLPEEFMRTLYEEQLQCVSALQVGTQLHINQNESLADRFEHVDVAMWHGLDLGEKEFTPFLNGLHAEHFINGSSAQHGHLYGLLGPFDSGTNLLEAMIHVNFPGMTPSVRNSWKHSARSVPEITQEMAKWAQASGQQLRDIVLITMVRSPISQIVSWRKSPYDLEKCMLRSWPDMGHPCRAPLRKTLRNGPHNQSRFMNFSSTMDVYNTYLQRYRELKDSGVFKDVLMIQYEDLVLDPISVMVQIGRKLNITPPVPFKIVTNPAKPHGGPEGREGALIKLAKRTWMGRVSAHLGTLCKGLNGSLIKGLVEGSYRDVHRQVPYSHDCRGFKMLGGTAK